MWLTAAFGGLATPPKLQTQHQILLIFQLSRNLHGRSHIQRPRREKEGVSSRRSTKFRERLKVEEFALGEDETPSRPTDCKFERTNRHTEKAGLNLIHYDRL